MNMQMSFVTIRRKIWYSALYILVVFIVTGKGQIVTIDGPVISYGQKLTLFCQVDNCCDKSPGWEKWEPDLKSLFYDVGPAAKYSATVRSDGFTLDIKNLTKDDLNKNYSCTYGFARSNKLLLSEENVFQSQKITIDGPVANYGQNLRLFCQVDNCCDQLPGWEKWEPSLKTIISNVRNVTFGPTEKYSATVRSDGYTLVIKNLTKDDLNKSYSCTHRFVRSNKLLLSEENVFRTDNQDSDIKTTSSRVENNVVDDTDLTMKISLMLSILILVQGIPSKNEDAKTVFATIGDTAILSCKLNPEAKSQRWRKDDKVLSDGSGISDNAPGHERRKILGDSTEFYRLEITGITRQDFGVYVCGMQVEHGIEETHFILTLRADIATTYRATSTSTVTDTENNTLENRKTDRQTTLGNEEKDVTGIGLSTREIFYYSLLATGLALVLCLSVGCNICINRKCKSLVVNQQPNEKLNSNNKDIPEEEENNIDMKPFGLFEDMDSSYSHYEAIDESKMVRYPVTNQPVDVEIHVNCFTEIEDTNVDERPYLEVIPDDDDIHEVKFTENSRFLQSECKILEKNGISLPYESKSETRRSTLQENTDNERPHTKLQSIAEHSSSSNSSSKESITVYRQDDEYLHPYVPLDKNQMEYLHSYSIPIKPNSEKTDVDKDPIQENVNPYVPLDTSQIEYLHSYNTLITHDPEQTNVDKDPIKLGHVADDVNNSESFLNDCICDDNDEEIQEKFEILTSIGNMQFNMTYTNSRCTKFTK